MFNILSKNVKIIGDKKNEDDRQKDLKREIEQFSKKLKEFRISYRSLTSVKREKEDKRLVIAIVNCVLEEKELMEHVIQTKALPIEVLSEKYGFHKSFCQKHKKYIIALCLIKSEYPMLNDLLSR